MTKGYRVPTCSVHWGMHCIFIPLPSYPDLSSQIRYFKQLRKKLSRSKCEESVFGLSHLYSNRSFSILSSLCENQEMGLSPTTEKLRFWATTQLQQLRLEGKPEENQWEHLHRYVPSHKISSKSTLVEWTTLCAGNLPWRKIRYHRYHYLLMESFNAQYMWCFWISIPFQLSVSHRYSHLSRLQDHWKEILSSHPTTQHTLQCMLGKFTQLPCRRNSFGGWGK